MKKVIMISLMILLMASMAFATTPAAAKYAIEQQQKSSQNNAVKTQTQTQQRVQSEVKGLENAMLRVRNEEQKKHLEQVMEKIQEKKLEQLNKLKDLEIQENEEGDVEATGIGEAYFLGLFKVNKRHRYMISEEGEVEKQKGPLDFLFTAGSQVE